MAVTAWGGKTLATTQTGKKNATQLNVRQMCLDYFSDE